MISVPSRRSLRRALPGALLLLAGCSRAPALHYDMAGLAAHDPCGRAPAVECLSPTPPLLAYDLAVALSDLFAPRRPANPLRLVVSLTRQRLFAYREGALVTTSPVSTGKPGHATPPGLYHISQKQIFHLSNQYSNAPMPYMQRLTASGIALHAGQLPGYPASHGCIRLPLAMAKRLYRMTSPGTPVLVTRGASGTGGTRCARPRKACARRG